MPMASQVELQNRYADLLKPIKDLTRNWNVDVASQLEEYIEEVSRGAAAADHNTVALAVWVYTVYTVAMACTSLHCIHCSYVCTSLHCIHCSYGLYGSTLYTL